ncbi:hypothetical protein ABPG74_021913 [Tetrahymena malaccensis]
MSDDEMPPELDDLTEVIQKARPKEEKSSTQNLGDYTKTREEIQKEVSDQLAKEMEQKMKLKAEEEKRKQEEEAKKPKDTKKQGLFGGGLAKGFLSNPAPKAAKKQEEIIEVKVNKEEQKKNKLEIKEVQEAMKLNDTLNSTKDQWMNPQLLNQIATNPLIAKLFTNPEYMQAISLMQTKPKEAMERYGKNPEFMMVFQEFCKVMGNHFQDLSTKEKEEASKKEQEKPLLQKVEKLDPDQKRINDLIQNDAQVKEALQDPKVVQFIQFLQTQKKVDFHSVMQKDKDLAKKLQILIQKGILNIQGL